jgi:hypothetical protein
MATIVLVPGAGGMAWYWHRVAPLIHMRDSKPSRSICLATAKAVVSRRMRTSSSAPARNEAITSKHYYAYGASFDLCFCSR